MKREIIIAGNWKMNKTPSETESLLEEIKAKMPQNAHKFIICPPFTSLCKAVELTKGTEIIVGAQNCHYEENGAYTGEISAKMLSEIGIQFVILGHSERREYFSETDETVNKKIKASLKNNIKVILCVGESLAQREENITNSHINGQLVGALKDISSEDLENIIIAYEPIWAIGTGKTATEEQAEDVCKFIRLVISELYNSEAAEKIHILYGGSMNENNATKLLSMENIDGGLIGGASLKADSITKILAI